MKSESLVRLDTADPPAINGESAAARRQNLMLHVEQFLARGGQIVEVPSTCMARPIYRFNWGDRGSRIKDTA